MVNGGKRYKENNTNKQCCLLSPVFFHKCSCFLLLCFQFCFIFLQDCSAIHEVPRLTILQHGLSSLNIGEMSTHFFSFLFKIHNTLLNPIQVRVTTSHEQNYTPILENVILDPYDVEKQSEEIHITPSASKIGTNSSASSTWIELDTAQELQLLEIYTGDKDKKEEWVDYIKGWDAKRSIQRYIDSNKCQINTEKDGNFSSFVLLGVDKDTAWVEWTGKVDKTNMTSLAMSMDRSSSYRAIPLAMQVVRIGGALVGISSSSNSSSTKISNPSHDHDKGKENNMLTFPLLAVWQPVDDDQHFL